MVKMSSVDYLSMPKAEVSVFALRRATCRLREDPKRKSNKVQSSAEAHMEVNKATALQLLPARKSNIKMQG